MKFHRIEIDAFGALSGTDIDGLASGANVIYGPNGAGKTTLLHFLRGLFCGYAGARKLGLLPASGVAADGAANGGPGGGSVDLTWRGGRCRFARGADADAESTLRPAVVRSDGRATDSSSTSAPSLTSDDLPTDLIPLLYTVGHADGNDVDKLVQRAFEDGIGLVTNGSVARDGASRGAAPGRATAAAPDAERQSAAHVGPQRIAPDHGRVAEIRERRRRIRTELQQLRNELEERCRLVTEEHRATRANERLHGRGRVDWFHAELQAAESDLREVEDRLWRQDHPQRPVARTIAPLLRLRRVPSTSHVEVAHQKELEEIDRQVADARSQLESIAKSRLDVNLRMARIAGTPTLPMDEFLKKLRASLSVMEDALLELQEDAERFNTSRTRHQPLAGEWPSMVKRTAEDVRRQLYGTCESVSQFERQHLQAQWELEAVRLDQDEQAQLRQLAELEEQRQQLVARTGHLSVWRGPAQRTAEQELCECAEHESFEERHSTNSAASDTIADVIPDAVESHSWPARQELVRLRDRCDRLRTDLDKARAELCKTANRSDGFELPHDVQRLDWRVAQKQLELDAVERELSDSHQQQRVPLGTSEVASHTVETTEPDIRPECIQWASEYLSRLTDGRYESVRIMPGQHDVRVVDEHGTEHRRQTLSRGLLGQLALSLRLALVRAYAKRGVRFPFVLDDILVDCDVERLRRAVQLLKEFADEQGQQILYLTCGTPVVRLFESVGATVRALPGSVLAPRRLETAADEPWKWSVQGWIDNRSRKPNAARSEESRGESPQTESTPGARTSEPTAGLVDSSRGTPDSHLSQEHVSSEHGDSGVTPLRRRQPGGPYWLTKDSPLVLVPSIGEQMGRRMTALGIRTVSDLLDLAAEDSSVPLRSLQVDIGRLREWQAEALLLSCVPDIAGPDAQLLVACGVHGPGQLAECDITELISRLDRFAQRNRESHIRANLPTREDLQRWIHNARRARSPEQARRDGGRERRSRGEEIISHRMMPQSGRGTAAARDETVSPNETVSLRETVGADETVAEEDARAVVARFVPSAQTSSVSGSTQRTFYLSPESPVVDAPSIGPKMASRLVTLGIITVGDLLARQAAEVAGRLKQRRVKADTVALWQQQARLMCRIPQLRGHDAQVLVACDITEPEQVAGLDARTLFGIVGPFVATREGQRLLRSSKTPDLQEVAAWIDWANHARPLRAA